MARWMQAALKGRHVSLSALRDRSMHLRIAPPGQAAGWNNRLSNWQTAGFSNFSREFSPVVWAYAQRSVDGGRQITRLLTENLLGK